MTIAKHLKQAYQQLSHLESGRLDAELLLAKVLNQSRSYILAYSDQALTQTQIDDYQNLLQQRAKKIPLAYLLGEKEFWSLTFKVTPDVLIPRPETELLVEKILADYQNCTELTVIDAGTGSGAIAIALAYEQTSWKIIASDVSESALAVARENAETVISARNDNITFLHSNWFDQFPEDLKADVIVSNPPYLAEDDPHLIDSEISHEPRLALRSIQATVHYDLIAHQAKKFLKPGGRIYFEHGCEQAAEVAKILKQAGYQDVVNVKDFAQLARMTMATLMKI